MACRTDSVSTQLRRLGDGKSGVAGEDTPELLRQRSPIPEPPSGFWLRERSPIPEPSLHGCLSSLRRALLSQVRSSHLPDMGGDHGFLVGRDHPG